jgi:hypothetical protein
LAGPGGTTFAARLLRKRLQQDGHQFVRHFELDEMSAGQRIDRGRANGATPTPWGVAANDRSPPNAVVDRTYCYNVILCPGRAATRSDPVGDGLATCGASNHAFSAVVFVG